MRSSTRNSEPELAEFYFSTSVMSQEPSRQQQYRAQDGEIEPDSAFNHLVQNDFQLTTELESVPDPRQGIINVTTSNNEVPFIEGINLQHSAPLHNISPTTLYFEPGLTNINQPQMYSFQSVSSCSVPTSSFQLSQPTTLHNQMHQGQPSEISTGGMQLNDLQFMQQQTPIHIQKDSNSVFSHSSSRRIRRQNLNPQRTISRTSHASHKPESRPKMDIRQGSERVKKTCSRCQTRNHIRRNVCFECKEEFIAKKSKSKERTNRSIAGPSTRNPRHSQNMLPQPSEDEKLVSGTFLIQPNSNAEIERGHLASPVSFENMQSNVGLRQLTLDDSNRTLEDFQHDSQRSEEDGTTGEDSNDQNLYVNISHIGN